MQASMLGASEAELMLGRRSGRGLLLDARSTALLHCGPDAPARPLPMKNKVPDGSLAVARNVIKQL